MRLILLIGAMLIGVLLVSIGSMYVMGALSATGLNIQIFKVDRRYNPSPPHMFLEYTVDLLVSGRASMTTLLNNPSFDLLVNGNLIGQATPANGSFGPFTGQGYTLTFSTSSPDLARALAKEANETIKLQLTATSSAGMYSGIARASTSSLFSFPPSMVHLTGKAVFPGSFDATNCFCYLRFYDGYVYRNATVKAASSIQGTTTGEYSIMLPNNADYGVTIWTAPSIAWVSRICDAGSLTVQSNIFSDDSAISC